MPRNRTRSLLAATACLYMGAWFAPAFVLPRHLFSASTPLEHYYYGWDALRIALSSVTSPEPYEGLLSMAASAVAFLSAAGNLVVLWVLAIGACSKLRY